MNATGTGIGRTLRKARESRGQSLEQASRETRIREEYLSALERENFDRLLGDVYVRGFLRSYAGYLGLDAEEILSAYNRSHGHHQPTSPPPAAAIPALAQNPDGHPLIHRRANWRLAGAIAGGLLALVALIAVIAGSNQDPAGLEIPPPTLEPSTPPVIVNVIATAPVEAKIWQDGVVVFEGRLARDEARSFRGDESVAVKLADAGAVLLTVNGRQLGRAGDPGVAYENTFGPEDYRRSPSNGG